MSFVCACVGLVFCLIGVVCIYYLLCLSVFDALYCSACLLRLFLVCVAYVRVLLFALVSVVVFVVLLFALFVDCLLFDLCCLCVVLVAVVLVCSCCLLLVYCCVVFCLCLFGFVSRFSICAVCAGWCLLPLSSFFVFDSVRLCFLSSFVRAPSVCCDLFSFVCLSCLLCSYRASRCAFSFLSYFVDGFVK